MISQETIDKINELARKSKVTELSEEEKLLQARLRREYIDAFKANLKGQLETIKIQNPDGSIIDVKERHDKRMANEGKNAGKVGN